jgi:hypothetical protein
MSSYSPTHHTGAHTSHLRTLSKTRKLRRQHLSVIAVAQGSSLKGAAHYTSRLRPVNNFSLTNRQKVQVLVIFDLVGQPHATAQTSGGEAGGRKPCHRFARFLNKKSMCVRDLTCVVDNAYGTAVVQGSCPACACVQVEPFDP